MSSLNFPTHWGRPAVFLFLIEQANHLERMRYLLEDEHADLEIYLQILPAVKEMRHRVRQVAELFDSDPTIQHPIRSDCNRLIDRLEVLLTALVRLRNVAPETLARLREEHLAGCCHRIEYFELQLRELAAVALCASKN